MVRGWVDWERLAAEAIDVFIDRGETRLTVFRGGWVIDEAESIGLLVVCLLMNRDETSPSLTGSE